MIHRALQRLNRIGRHLVVPNPSVNTSRLAAGFGTEAKDGISIAGMAHVVLSVVDFEKSAKFYKSLLPFLGLKLVSDSPQFCYHVGGKTALGIMPCTSVNEDQKFVQGKLGLHHLCFRARSKEDVDKVC
mmetsp:Transcript_29518/g.51847  ORF Transcript_29518/g.51847 Transcript_29518/m.51847 type:complete len:129 (+) Transcript_29518:137-523(+)